MMDVGFAVNPEGAKQFMEVLSSLDTNTPQECELIRKALLGWPEIFSGLVRSGQGNELLDFMVSLDPKADPEHSLLRSFLSQSRLYSAAERQSEAFKSIQARTQVASSQGGGCSGPDRPDLTTGGSETSFTPK
jgi:hypothetical protein